MMDKVHILKAFEGHGQNQSFDVLVGISAPGENTGAFLCDFSLLHALLIEGRELLHDVFNPGLSTVIRSVTKCCMLRILKLLNRLRREAEFHWRLEPYAGKLARTVFRGEDGSNVIFLLDVYKCSESLRSRKAKQYPTHYKDSRTARYKDDIAKKKICADCVGLIKGYNWVRPDRV